MRVDAYASSAHYLEHILPVWQALPESARGTLYLAARLTAGVPSKHGRPPRSDAPVLVASYADEKFVRRPVVLMEHGAGQSYGYPHPAFAGGTHREAVRLFLTPNEQSAERNRHLYPNTPTVVIGCPAMDQWYPPPPPAEPDLVALAWHWDMRLFPEGRTALPHYQAVLPELAREFRLLGHGHPRAWPVLRPMYHRLRMESTPSLSEVLRRAAVLVCDNSSALFAFASLDRPVILLNAPWYRRDVEHGLRFWTEADIGEQVDHPRDLAAAIRRALADPSRGATVRLAAAGHVYAYMDGGAAERGATAILALLARYASPQPPPGVDVYDPFKAKPRPIRLKVPSGPVREVLTWVGADLNRARLALTTERATLKPRSSLVSDLSRMLGD